MNIKKIPSAVNAFKFPLLIKNILNYSLVLEPENEIVYRDLVRYNYFELNKRVRKLANVLRDLNITGGETIAVMDYDSHRYLEAYFAVPMTGNVLHTINWRLSPEQILFTIQHAEDLVLIINTDFLPIIESFQGKMPSVKKIILMSDEKNIASTTLDTVGEYEQLLASASDEYDFEDFDEDAIATTFYTTGTTGDPKGVFFSHRQLVLHTMGIGLNSGFKGGAACHLSNDDTYMPLTPLFHVHAWGFPLLATMFSMKQIYIGKFEPEMILQLFAKEKPTFSHCVPTILQMLVSHPAAKNLDLNGWKVVIGGSALPKTLCRESLERGVDVITGYGMSETCPIVSTVYISTKDKDKDIEWQVESRTRTGVLAPFVDIQIINENNEPIKNDDQEKGEIVVRAPWLTQGYFKEPQKGEELWENGFLHTGDVATMNTKNSMKIIDRIKDVIKTGGEWVSSIDLENIIGQHNAVAEVAVVGVPDAKWGERPYALVVLKEGQRATKEEIIQYFQIFVDSGKLSKWAVPQSIDFTTAIPKTSVGKLDKKAIRSQLI